MTPENLWSIPWLDAWEQVRKDTNKVTEQDVKRVQSDSQQAKKVQEEIKKSKIINNNLANFLSFLLKELKNEDLVSNVYNTFFKTIDPKTKISYLRKDINTVVIIGLFVPFFDNKLKIFCIEEYFEWLYDRQKLPINFDRYIDYIKKLSRKYHDNVPVDQKKLLNLLALIVNEFQLLKDKVDQDLEEKIKKNLLKK